VETGVWLRANETEISAALWALWLGKDFAFLRGNIPEFLCVHSGSASRTMATGKQQKGSCMNEVKVRKHVDGGEEWNDWNPPP